MKVLWVKTELLHPVDKGGKIRTYEMLKRLRREHEVTYLTLDDGTAAPDAVACATEYCQHVVTVPHRTAAKFSPRFYAELAMNLASPLPYAVRKYESPEMRREIARRVERDRPDVLVCDFLAPAINIPKSLPCATVLFQHNVEAQIWRRHSETQTHPVKRQYLRGQWRKMREFERAACRRFDQVIAVSREDEQTMRREYGVEAIADVPTGVDTDYFRPDAVGEPAPFSLVFTGSMDWLPNVDAIHYFHQEVFPRVRALVPRVMLAVVGRNPAASLLELARRDPSVTVTGRVEDVRPYIANAAGYIVPIRIGGGTRLKIYEAMAMGKPIISTSVGAEGLPLRDGQDLLLADTPETFAAAVARVLTDAAFARELGARAAATVGERFGWARVAAGFADLCRDAIERHAAQEAGQPIGLSPETGQKQTPLPIPPAALSARTEGTMNRSQAGG